MKRFTIASVVVISLLISVGCASKKGAYYPVPAPRVIEKVVVKTDTVYIIKHDTLVLRDTVMLRDTIRIETEKIQPVVQEEPKIRVAEEKISLVEGEANTKLMTMKYHVVVGSFKNKDNAKKRQQEFTPAYSPTLVINEQGMYRVILLSFDEYESAKLAIKDLSGTLPKDTWVLRQKQ